MRFVTSNLEFSSFFVVKTLISVLLLNFIFLASVDDTAIPGFYSVNSFSVLAPLPTRRSHLERFYRDGMSSSVLFYQRNETETEGKDEKIITSSDSNSTSSSTTETAAVTIILPKSYTSTSKSPASDPSLANSISGAGGGSGSGSVTAGVTTDIYSRTKNVVSDRIRTLREKFRQLKPGTRFRWKLGFVTTAFVALSSLMGGVGTSIKVLSNPKYFSKGTIQLFHLVKTWLSHRGWQGLAAMGRAIAYGWALLVAYPRLLDKRQQDKRKQKRADLKAMRRRRLTRLADQVSKLRSELRQIDAEIRSFKREIIAMKAYRTSSSSSSRSQSTSNIIGIDEEKGSDSSTSGGSSSSRDESSRSDSSRIDDIDIQDAIDEEMADLRHLRHDTYASFVAARKAYTDYRAATVAELADEYDDDDDDFDVDHFLR